MKIAANRLNRSYCTTLIRTVRDSRPRLRRAK